jgi:hypothetical protein
LLLLAVLVVLKVLKHRLKYFTLRMFDNFI